METTFPIAALFDCDRCGRLASTITVLPSGMVDPQATLLGMPGYISGKELLFVDAARLSIDGPLGVTHNLAAPGTPGFEAVVTAVSSGDPVALYLHDREKAPFWCPTCALSYCSTCWMTWIDFDDGFYDCTRGRCPAGHERILDD